MGVQSGGKCARIGGHAVGVVDRSCSAYNGISAKMGGQDFGAQPVLGLIRVKVRVFMEVASLLVVEVVVQICPDEPWNIPSFVAVEVNHAPQRVCAKDDAPENICFMSVTLDTSHLDMSPLNDDAPENICFMSVTLDTSHLEMSQLNDDAK